VHKKHFSKLTLRLDKHFQFAFAIQISSYFDLMKTNGKDKEKWDGINKICIFSMQDFTFLKQFLVADCT
jgi:hypothetical protein